MLHTDRPDWQSVMQYVAQIYKYTSRRKSGGSACCSSLLRPPPSLPRASTHTRNSQVHHAHLERRRTWPVSGGATLSWAPLLRGSPAVCSLELP